MFLYSSSGPQGRAVIIPHGKIVTSPSVTEVCMFPVHKSVLQFSSRVEKNEQPETWHMKCNFDQVQKS